MFSLGDGTIEAMVSVTGMVAIRYQFILVSVSQNVDAMMMMTIPTWVGGSTET